ncbi:hypothetical protein RUM44_007328 [Polyplax serrata]|uniref:Uncharacterized protein n=1 Tax=Polyplax serrata TaxID=468196 RepID=A0ABR1B0D2_POLSC
MGREHEETGIFVELCTPAKLWMEVTLKWSFEGFLRKSSLCVPLLPTGANQITTHSYFYDYKSHFSHAVETRRTSELPQLIGGKEVLESFEDRDRVHKAQIVLLATFEMVGKILIGLPKTAEVVSCGYDLVKEFRLSPARVLPEVRVMRSPIRVNKRGVEIACDYYWHVCRGRGRGCGVARKWKQQKKPYRVSV